MRKNLTTAIVILTAALSANAQESFVPHKGNVSTEISFSPFNLEGNTFKMTSLNLRGFVSDKDALTFELGLGGTKTKSMPDKDLTYYTREHEGQFGLSVGYQRHFYQYKRLDLYAGGRVAYAHVFAAEKKHYSDREWYWNNEGTGNGFGAAVITGIDFYVYHKLYIGAEIGLGFTDVVASNVTEKYCFNGKVNSRKTNQGGYTFSGGFECTSSLRLGWTF